MSGSGVLENPAMPAVSAGHQEQLKMSHVKVDENLFGVDPNMDFCSSQINVEDRVYICDTTPTALNPISWTVQPQFNMFKSLSESRFVFQVSLSGTNHTNGAVFTTGTYWTYFPKAYFSALFVTDFTANINNVNCSDQHSSTAQYAHFIKTILLDANIKSCNSGSIETYNFNQAGNVVASWALPTVAGDDSRTLTEGIISTDWLNGLTSSQSAHGILLSCIDGSSLNQNFTNNSSAIEITYRPKDGLFLSPKYLPPGVVENIIIRLNTVKNIFECSNSAVSVTPGTSATYVWHDDDPASAVTMNILSAKYYQRQITPTQSALRSYQSLISMQPVYIPVVSANTFLIPVPANQASVQLTNVLAGRIPAVVIVGLLNNNPCSGLNYFTPGGGATHQFKTYSPILARDTPNIYATCLQTVRLTVNGRLYSHLFSINCTTALANNTQDLSQLYEMYKQGCIIKDLNNRGDGASNKNLNLNYKMDNPILSYGEFRANFTYFVFVIRRNGTLVDKSGDREVGGIDILASIDTGRASPSGLSQLLVCGLNSDSLASFSDGGSTTSFVY
jgi:hypothetical protein